jgi:hypothetical protein
MSEEVTVNVIPDSTNQDTEEHIQQMVDKVDGGGEEPSNSSQEDNGGEEPQGNKEGEETGLKVDNTDEAKKDEDAGTDGKGEAGSSDQPEETSGIFSEKEWADYSNEVQENGELSEESLKQIVAKGIPEQVVKDYIAGVKAQEKIQAQQVEITKQELFSLTQGEEGYKAMQEWAKDNLTPSEKEAFNNAVYSGNPDMAKLAVSGLHARFMTNNPDTSSVNLLSGSPSASGSSSQTYNSWAEVKADMRSQEYKTDPAFQQRVRAKLARSRI